MQTQPDPKAVNTPDFFEANLLVRAPRRKKPVEWIDEYFEPELAKPSVPVRRHATAPAWSALHD